MFRFDPNDTDPVVRSANRRVHREAIRQLDSIDLDDPDDTVDPLPRFDVNVEAEANSEIADRA